MNSQHKQPLSENKVVLIKKAIDDAETIFKSVDNTGKAVQYIY
jgi:hypothetical protein